MKSRLATLTVFMACMLGCIAARPAAAADAQICAWLQSAAASGIDGWFAVKCFEGGYLHPTGPMVGVVDIERTDDGALLTLTVNPLDGCDQVTCDAIPMYPGGGQPLHFTASEGTWEAQLPAYPYSASIGCSCHVD